MSEPPLLAGKVALVTGGSRGIGRAITVALAGEGADVAFSYRQDARAAREVATLVERLGRRAIAVASDAAVPEHAEDLVERTRSELGPIDVAVANAGIASSSGWENVAAEHWRELLATDLIGPYALVDAVRSRMGPDGGSIVMMSSIAGLTGFPGEMVYAAAKAGLLSLTRTLALALAPRIRVNAVAPGWVRTDLNASLHSDPRANEAIVRRIPRGRWGEPEDVAAAVVFLASAGARFMTGETLVVDGGNSIRSSAAGL
ncbi:MAG TPA: glucose 1-dehydrogenase [Thermoplasmata archaeon]|nr:glucose 1-dehydrogenase [Thermoplasmata archaeon]